MTRHATIVLSLLLAAGCAGQQLQKTGRSAAMLVSEPSGCASVVDFGATPGDSTEDQGAFQAALAACAAAGGGTVLVPPGVFTLAIVTGRPYAVELPGGVELRGLSRAGSVLELATVAATSRMFYLAADAADAALVDLTLDGRRAAQPANEQVHGVFAGPSSRLRLERLNVRDFPGDGVYFYNEANDAVLRDVRSTGNGRNGLTFGGNMRGATIVDSIFTGNAAQQVDSEPGVPNIVSDISLRGCLLESAPSTDFALTISGNGSATKGHGWDVTGNRIRGAVAIVWAERVALVGNVIRNPDPKPAVWVYRSSAGILISGNIIEALHPTVTSRAAVAIEATGVGNQPDDVVVSDNEIRVALASNFGVSIMGALRATVTGNTLRGAGAATGYSAIRTRSTVPIRSVVIQANTIRDFGAGVTSVVDQPIAYSSVAGNVLDNGTTVAPTP